MRIPNPFRITRNDGTKFLLQPEAWKLADAKRLHEWSGRLVAYLEKIKARK